MLYILHSEIKDRYTQGSPQFPCFDFKLLVFVSVFLNITIPQYSNEKVLVWYCIV